MSFLINNTRVCMQTINCNLAKLSISPILIQTRSHNRKQLNHPKLKNPYWFVRKERVLHEDHISLENKNFIKDVIQDRYGTPSVIKGVLSYGNSSKNLINYEELPKVQWTPKCVRTGVIARKIGQCPLWKKDGTRIMTTLLQVSDNHVIKYIKPEDFNPVRKLNKNGAPSYYGCLMVGAESTDPSLLTKEYCGLFKDSGVMPKKILGRFLISPSAYLPPGSPLNVTHFRVGETVDVRGKTKYRGFQGVMRRHGFSGMPATHGVTKTHRRGGNIGAGGEKARVWPGTKMPGHMGNRYRIAKGLTIWRINTQYNVMWVSGIAIPGDINGIVYIYDTKLPLRKPKTPLAYPTTFDVDDSKTQLDTTQTKLDIWHEDLHDFKDPTILFTTE